MFNERKKDEICETTPGALYPINNLAETDIKSYKKALDSALKDDRINNIAVTAPYGVGKSTVLESYFKLRKKSYPWNIKFYNRTIRKINLIKKQLYLSPKLFNEIEDYEFISLPNFFDSLESSELQKKVVEQLLFKSNPKRFPFSKLKRIKDTSWVTDIITLLTSFFTITACFYLYLKITKQQNTFIDFLSIFNLLDFFLITLVSVLLISLLVWLVRNLRVALSKSTIVGKGTIGPLEFSNSPDTENNDTNIFNILSEELLYFFRVSRTKIIIFEDLDRFGKPEIFQELRELNTNINKRQPKVVFIYSLQDKVFEKIIENENARIDQVNDNGNDFEINTISDNRVRSKAKFFDYVIPIFPVTSLYNSSSTIECELGKYNISPEEGDGRISIGFLRSMGLFLKDQRMIILIVSEFHTYLEILNSNEKNDFDLKSLFSMIVYKNFYADDFEKVGYGSSLLNKIFDNNHLLYSELSNIKTIQLHNVREKLEQRLQVLKNNLDYDVNAILNSYYWKLKIKYHVTNDLNNQYLSVQGQAYHKDDGYKFFSDIAKLDESTLIYVKHGASNANYNHFTVGDALTVAGEITRDRIAVLLESHSDGKMISELIKSVNMELKNTLTQISNISNDTYRLPTEIILKELSEVYEKEDDLGRALRDITKDNFKRFLFFNGYISQNFYRYISPVEFGGNQKDSHFIESILSYNDLEDYSITDIKNTIKELDLAKANYSFAYSSNLLAYLLNIEGYDLQIYLILNKMIEKNDFSFWDNFISYSIKNKLSILKGLYLLGDISNPFFIESFTKISAVNNNFSLKIVINNIKQMISNLGEAVVEETFSFLINDISSFYNILNILMRIDGGSTVKSYGKYFKVKELLQLVEATGNKNNLELIEYIYKHALYEPNYNNIESLGKLFDIEINFNLYTEQFKNMDTQHLDLNTLRKFFETKYNEGSQESYLGLEEYIDFILREHDFYKKFEKEPLAELDIKNERYKCLVYFSKISFKNEAYESNRKITEKLDLINLINNDLLEADILLKLISKHRLAFSCELVESFSKKYPSLTTAYLLSVYRINPEFVSNYFEKIEQLLSEKEKLCLIKEVPAQEDYLKIGSFLLGDTETWKSLLQDNQSFFDKKMTAKILQLNDFLLHKLMFGITHGAEQAKILHSLLTKFPKKLSLPEFERILGIEPYFSTFTPDGRVRHSNNTAISKNVIDVLSELGVIGYRNGKKDFVWKKEVNNYFS